MVYCTKCGTKNEDEAEARIKCGASIGTRPAWRHERRRAEEECFGLPHGGAIVGLIIGVMIIIAGISWLAEINLERHFWPFIVIIFGILIVAGALYGYSRKS